MRTIFALAALPFFCLLGFAIILVVVIYLAVRNFRSNTTSISSSNPVAKDANTTDNPRSDSRWERADLSSSQTQISAKSKSKPCPACGGENPIGASQCEFCRSNLSDKLN